MAAQGKKRSFKTKLIITVMAVNLIITALFLLIIYRLNANLLTHESRRTAEAALNGLVQRIESFIEGKAKISHSLANNPQIVSWMRRNTERLPDRKKDLEYDGFLNYFSALKEQDKDLYSIFLASEKTQMYYDTTSEALPEDYRIDNRPWYKRLKELNKDYFVVMNNVFGQTRINHYAPVFDADQTLLGACGVDITIDSANHFLTETNPFNSSTLFLIDEQGQIIIHPDPGKVLKENLTQYLDDGKRFTGVQALVDKIIKGEAVFESVRYEGTPTILISKPIPKLGFRLIMTVDESELDAPLTHLINQTVLISVVNALLLLGVIWFSMSRIIRPLRQLTERVGTLAHGEGDLRQRIVIQSHDELGELATELNHFIAGLQEIVSQVKENTQIVSSSSHQFSATTEELAATAEQQNIQSQSVSVSIKHLAEASDSIADSVEETQTKISLSTQLTGEGDRVIRSSLEVLQQIQNNALGLSTTLVGLKQSTEQINKITDVINEVADQTNLLALNAAIESARAGEAGRGFGVVAAEVRKLAERTARSTREITSIIQTLQQEADNATLAMDEVNEEINKGNTLSQESLRIFERLVTIGHEVMESSLQILGSVQEENRSIEEINDNLNAMAIGSNEAAQAVRNLAVTAEDLSSQAEHLQSQIERFKT